MAEVIIALDVPGRDQAEDLVERLQPEACFFKVGLELFTRAGPSFVRELRDGGLRVFLDLKLHDIPNTVRRAVEAAAELEVDLLTVHATGGRRMIEEARAAVRGSRTRVLAVTALTSLDAVTLEAVWGRTAVDPRVEVVRLAALAMEGGAHGVVASPAEAAGLRARLGSGALIVTPGIRLAGDETHDQARVATPVDATRAGADYLVIGRPVSRASDPLGALKRIRAEVEAA